MSRPSLILTAILLFSQVGCVHRRMTIQTNPPGALVKVDGKDVGYSPTSIDFTWYGQREVQVMKDGYQTQTQIVSLDAPWYQKFPLDFVSDNFLGTHVRDHRRFTIQMQPWKTETSSNVIQRGRSLRSEAVHGL